MKDNTKKLVNESDLNEKIKTLAAKEEIKRLAKLAELKTEQDKVVTPQTYDLGLFFWSKVQWWNNNVGAQLYLILQPSCKTIAIFSGLPLTI